MKQVPLLWQMRAAVSKDGRVAKFFLTFKGGQNTAFAIPFHKMGLFMRAVSSTLGAMADRLDASKTAEIAEGLAQLKPLSIKTVAYGRDAESGERLLWIETTESGPFAFRLTRDAAIALADVSQPSTDAGEFGIKKVAM